MASNTQIICLLFVIVAAVSSTLVKEKNVRKSRLILEYDWPKPSKNIQRFPHPESCSHFYQMHSDGSRSIKKCPGTDIFDYPSHQCKAFGFGKCLKKIAKLILSSGRPHFSCPFPWGLYPDTEDCSQFHECLGGKSFLRKCPNSTMFDKAERTCVSEKEVMCADESDDMKHDGYTCPYKWGYFTHPRDCSKYYECIRKLPNVRTCKKNMLFDNFERRCLPMEMVKCGTRFNPYESTSTTDDQVTSSSSGTDSARISTNPRTNSERFTTENLKTGYERIVFSKNPGNKFEKKFSTKNLKSESEREISTENSGTGIDYKVASEIWRTGIERRIYTENPRIRFDHKVSTEYPPVTEFDRKISTGKSKLFKEKASTEYPPWPEFDGKISKGKSILFKDRVSTEYPPSPWAEFDGKISKGKSILFKDKVSTEYPPSPWAEIDGKISKGKLILFKDKVSTEYPAWTEFDRKIFTGNPKTEFKDKISIENFKNGSEKTISSKNPMTRYEKLISTRNGMTAFERLSKENPRTETPPDEVILKTVGNESDRALPKKLTVGVSPTLMRILSKKYPSLSNILEI